MFHEVSGLLSIACYQNQKQNIDWYINKDLFVGETRSKYAKLKSRESGHDASLEFIVNPEDSDAV